MVGSGGYNRMVAVNRNRPDRWKADIAQSVDMFNDWFLQFAPRCLQENSGSNYARR